MKNITLLSQVDYLSGEEIILEGPIVSVISNEDNEKRPIAINLRLESSGEAVRTCTWEKNLLNIAEKGQRDQFIYRAKAIPSIYKEKIQQVKIISLESTGVVSTRKSERFSPEEGKKRVIEIMKTYIPPNSIFSKLITELVLNNPDFWEWPAASRIHHAYPGGLAKHSISVCDIAISLWQEYQGRNINIPLLAAGALLHDIGKLQEYTKNGERTQFGDLVSHLVSGYELVCNKLRQMSIDPTADLEAVLLGNIILSHHEKLEFGSPVQPGSLEALIVARADAIDALINTASENLDITQINTKTEKSAGLDTKLLKWHY